MPHQSSEFSKVPKVPYLKRSRFFLQSIAPQRCRAIAESEDSAARIHRNRSWTVASKVSIFLQLLILTWIRRPWVVTDILDPAPGIRLSGRIAATIALASAADGYEREMSASNFLHLAGYDFVKLAQKTVRVIDFDVSTCSNVMSSSESRIFLGCRAKRCAQVGALSE